MATIRAKCPKCSRTVEVPKLCDSLRKVIEEVSGAIQTD